MAMRSGGSQQMEFADLEMEQDSTETPDSFDAM
jgi:hypothetical protein